MSYGLGKHKSLLSEDALSQILKTNWESQTPGILASIVARISIAVLLCRLFGSRIWLRWYLYVVTALQTVAECLVIIVIWAQCKPVTALWTFTGSRDCWNPVIEKAIAFLGQGKFGITLRILKVKNSCPPQLYLHSVILLLFYSRS